MRISICAATKNRTDVFHQFLWSLIRQDYNDWDLMIVDDSDRPVDWNSLGIYPRLFAEITRTGHDVRVVRGPCVGRVGAAYQVGLAASSNSNPLFLRVDDDCWLEPDYLSRLAPAMKNPDVGACGGLFLHPGSPIDAIGTGDDRLKHCRINELSDQVNIQWFRHENTDPIEVEHLTANILFRRSWLDRIGGFETSLYRNHRDETQVTWRLWVEGARLLVEPSAVAWHFRAPTGGTRGNHPEVYLEDHRRFMSQRKTMKPGIHICLGHGIGDGFMATPMIRAMREMNPHRNIAVYAPWASEVLEGNPNVDEIARHPLDCQRTMRLEQSVYSWASAAGWEGHLAEAYCKMFGLPIPDDITPHFHWSKNLGKPVLEDPGLKSPYMVIAPFSTAMTMDLFDHSDNKNWPLDYWAPVVSWAHEKRIRVVQLRGSADEPLIDDIDHDFLHRPLREVFACIENSRFLVGVDTMAHHAAAAFNTPSVVLWGRSKPQHFGYEKPHIINIQGECTDRPCIGGNQWSMDIVKCPIPGHPCMESIKPGTVLEALERLADHL